MIIGVTGISGSGKSKTCEIMCKLRNAKLIDADEICKSMQVPRKSLF